MHLDGFPSIELTPDALLYRAHKWKYETVYYSATGDGRFDISTPEGTCYFSEAPLGAFLETFRDEPVFTEGMALQGAMATYRVRPRRLLIADCTDKRAAEFGIPEWLHDSASDRYGETQAWATRLRDAGFDGLRYWSRYSRKADREVRTFALFGPEGPWRELPETLQHFPTALLEVAAQAGANIGYYPPPSKLIAFTPHPESAGTEGMCINSHVATIGLLSAEAVLDPDRWTVGECPECDEPWKLVRFVDTEGSPLGDWVEIR